MSSFPAMILFPRKPPAAANDSGPSGPGRVQRWIDIPVRIVLGVFFAWCAGAYTQNALKFIQAADWANVDLTLAVDGLSIFAIALYTFTIACLYALRLKAINKFAGFVPAAVALLGGFMALALIALDQRHDLPLSWKITADLLIFGGNLFALWALRNLGRSFSIIPEARRLVTTGPYKYIRHPLYLAEAIAAMGALIVFLSPLAALIVFAQLGFQLGRIHYEERVLRENFPEYEEYSKRTARLIPGIY